jgi:hypothetical protein
MNTTKNQHTAVKHRGHTDYLENGHLLHREGGKVEEHTIEVDVQHPDRCTGDHEIGGHPKGHVHGPNCGHEVVPHGDHVDYLVNGHLHHPHGNHCDDHGVVEVVAGKS